jgi:hypothetical protein
MVIETTNSFLSKDSAKTAMFLQVGTNLLGLSTAFGEEEEEEYSGPVPKRYIAYIDYLFEQDGTLVPATVVQKLREHFGENGRDPDDWPKEHNFLKKLRTKISYIKAKWKKQRLKRLK